MTATLVKDIHGKALAQRYDKLCKTFHGDQFVKEWVLILGDLNAHSIIWNPHCCQRQNAGPLEELIERYELIVNNYLDFPIRSASRRISIIDLALTSSVLGLLCRGLKEIDSIWVILKESKKLRRERKKERKLDTSRKGYVRAANTNTLVNKHMTMH